MDAAPPKELIIWYYGTGHELELQEEEKRREALAFVPGVGCRTDRLHLEGAGMDRHGPGKMVGSY